MTDLCEKGSGSQDSKTCVDCGTAITPLWRGGPAGPKSLLVGSNRREEPTSTNEMIRSKDKVNSKSDVSLKLRLLALGRQEWQRKSALENLGSCFEIKSVKDPNIISFKCKFFLYT
ncbi:hypothetical protein ACHQM5_010066 [Ranunculus cassubicifolius]